VLTLSQRVELKLVKDRQMFHELS